MTIETVDRKVLSQNGTPVVVIEVRRYSDGWFALYLETKNILSVIGPLGSLAAAIEQGRVDSEKSFGSLDYELGLQDFPGFPGSWVHQRFEIN